MFVPLYSPQVLKSDYLDQPCCFHLHLSYVVPPKQQNIQVANSNSATLVLGLPKDFGMRPITLDGMEEVSFDFGICLNYNIVIPLFILKYSEHFCSWREG